MILLLFCKCFELPGLWSLAPEMSLQVQPRNARLARLRRHERQPDASCQMDIEMVGLKGLSPFTTWFLISLQSLAKMLDIHRHTLPRCREKLSSKSYMDFSTLLAPFCLSAAFSATMAERRCSSQALLEPDGENGWEWHKTCKTCWTWLVIDVCIHIYIYRYVV